MREDLKHFYTAALNKTSIADPYFQGMWDTAQKAIRALGDEILRLESEAARLSEKAEDFDRALTYYAQGHHFDVVSQAGSLRVTRVEDGNIARIAIQTWRETPDLATVKSPLFVTSTFPGGVVFRCPICQTVGGCPHWRPLGEEER